MLGCAFSVLQDTLPPLSGAAGAVCGVSSEGTGRCPGSHKAHVRVLPVPGFPLWALGTGLLPSFGSREM